MKQYKIDLEEILNGIEGKHPVEWLLENTPKTKADEIDDRIHEAGGYDYTIFRHREFRTEYYQGIPLQGKLLGYVDHHTGEYVVA